MPLHLVRPLNSLSTPPPTPPPPGGQRKEIFLDFSNEPSIEGTMTNTMP